jgi:putative ABC transport system ATP-binding protein
VIELRGVSRTYHSSAGPIVAVDDVSLTVAPGELLVVTGRSGSGKSTLLHLMSGVDLATAGIVRVNGQPLDARSDRTLARWRAATVGVVFQFFQLLPALTILENVQLPMDFLGLRPARERREYAMHLLVRVGVGDQAQRFPATLSGGQQQRVAVARALANDPKVITADEPTGNLDSETAAMVLTLFGEVAAAGTTVVLATHERDIAGVASRVVHLRDGRIRDAQLAADQNRGGPGPSTSSGSSRPNSQDDGSHPTGVDQIVSRAGDNGAPA